MLVVGVWLSGSVQVSPVDWKKNHRDTEGSEVAQRFGRMRRPNEIQMRLEAKLSKDGDAEDSEATPPHDSIGEGETSQQRQEDPTG